MLGREEHGRVGYSFRVRAASSLEIHESKEARPQASRRVREYVTRRHIYVHGEWHLWIGLCAWEIFCKGERLGSDRRGRISSEWSIRSTGRNSFVSRSPQGAMIALFEFDLGGMLITHRLPRWVEHDQWQLFDPSGHVLIVRGDKKYSYARSNQAHDAGPWKPVLLRGSRRRGDCLRSGLCSCDKGS